MAQPPLERRVGGGYASHEMTSATIWSLVAISAAIVAIIAAHIAHREADRAMRLLSSAIDRVRSSRSSRLASDSLSRMKAASANQAETKAKGARPA